MKKKEALKIICILFFLAAFFSVNAQLPVTGLQRIIAAVDSFNTVLPAEQLYVHFDKKEYAIDDTVWFKAYLLQRSNHAWSPLSGILYVEIISDSNRLIKRMSFPAAYGLSWGQISLDKKEFIGGNYFFRAYTNWMQNFGEGYFYTRPIRVSDPLSENWLIKEDHSLVSSADKNDIDFNLQLNNKENHPDKQKAVNLAILRSKKIISRQDMQTNADGIVKGKFSLPPNTASNEIKILVEDKADPLKRSVVPLFFSRPQNIDLQFMPESGYMVAGINSKIGFKAIDENGMGIDIKGRIVDSKNNEVARFTSVHRGMGAFRFTPAVNENYFAIADLPGGNTKRVSLPAVKNSGIILQCDNEQNSDSIKVSIHVSPELADGKIYYLLGLSRGVVCYAANITFRKTTLNAVIAKSLFPSGIAHFTLLNVSGQPINERMVFVDHADDLMIRLSSFKNNFSARDSIPLQIKVTDKNGLPVTGSFSIAVTDDGQVKTDDINGENIVTRMLLTADLKGNVEEADYYTSHSDSIAWQALDALLLTQGWTGYDWDRIMKPTLPEFTPEPVFSIKGRVTNLLNKPINKAHVVIMSSGARPDVKDTATNKNGEFIFTRFRKLDSLSFFIDARNAKDKKFGIGLKVDEFKPAEIKNLPVLNTIPWNVNSDSFLLQYAQNKQRIEEEFFQSSKYKRLQEVKLTGKKIIQGSSNLNGPGEADQVIDEAEIEKESGKSKNLLQLLKEKIKGFAVQGENDIYKLKNYNIMYVIDGINMANLGSARDVLEYLDAEDVKGIEVMYSQKFLSRYENTFLSMQQQMAMRQFVFIEITTRSGNGGFFRKLPGVVIYKPVPITLPIQFYSPKYSVKNKSENAKDLRSTIYWQPAVVTNKAGEATVYFYAASAATTYTIIIQGADISGSVGYKIEKINIR